VAENYQTLSSRDCLENRRSHFERPSWVTLETTTRYFRTFPIPLGSPRGGVFGISRQSLEKLFGNSQARANRLTMRRIMAA
jgi:hypothetical protein